MSQTYQLTAIIPPGRGTDNVGYTVLTDDDEQHAFESPNTNPRIQKPGIEQSGDKGILWQDSPFKTFSHKMKFPG